MVLNNNRNNQNLIMDLYELTMAQVYYRYKNDSKATFELFIRSDKRPFYIACGIDDCLDYLENFRFEKDQIEYLKSLALFDNEFLEYLKSFRFQGDVWAVEEPEIIFAGEPILRVTGNIIETQIVETILLNRINLAVTLATKATRVVMAAGGRAVYDFSLRRTQGNDAALAAAKYSYIAGVKGTSNLLAGYLYKIPVVGTMAHSFVMSFEREKDSFLAFAKLYPAKSILLIDTYSIKTGIQNALKVAQYLRREGINLLGIRLDSGNLIEDSKYVRHLLDRAGLIDTMIFASGDLDEYKIKEIVKSRAPIDAFGVGTHMGCSSDLPFVDVIYKLVALKERRRNNIPVMKLSKNKITYPYPKQIYRIEDKGRYREDIICLENEKFAGKKLLRLVMKKGRRIRKKLEIENKRKLFFEKISFLPPSLKDFTSSGGYAVKISARVEKSVEDVKKEMEKRNAPRIVFFDIDTQFDFLNKKGALYVDGADKIIGNIGKLTRYAYKNDIYIFSSQDTHREEDPEFKQFPPHCIERKKGVCKIKESVINNRVVLKYSKVYSLRELREKVSSHKQIILTKNVLNVFSNPNTLLLLDLLFPDLVVVYGVVTEYCVKEVIDGLIKYGFNVALVEDAVKEISFSIKDQLFSQWRKKGVSFFTTDEICKGVLFEKN